MRHAATLISLSGLLMLADGAAAAQSDSTEWHDAPAPRLPGSIPTLHMSLESVALRGGPAGESGRAEVASIRLRVRVDRPGGGRVEKVLHMTNLVVPGAFPAPDGMRAAYVAAARLLDGFLRDGEWVGSPANQ